MAEQKSKYLVWLETLHREYTERISITQLGRQAALLHLLADIYEVRCRFEKLLGRLQNEAIQMSDEDLNYQEWYNPEKWKVVNNTLKDEDIRETFGIKPDSPLAQTYANTMLTPFGDGANFDNDRFRNVVSSLFVLNTIVDEQKMEVAINSELEKLQKVLLDISNEKNRQKEPEEYAAWFESERVKYGRNFITMSKLKAEHETWKKSIYDDDYKEALKERRVELLLELFDSGFLDDLKGKSHRKAEDVLGFKKYEFEKWNERMDEAIRYFATMCKICPFKDDMIRFDDHAKIGRYILDEHIEAPMVNAFLKAMELILMVQKEMIRLENPDLEDESDRKSPVVFFVQRVKHIMLKAEEDNGSEMQLTARGHGGTYIYNVDGKGFCSVMDNLLACHEILIKDYLEGATTEQAISIKYVAPFIGSVLDTHLYSSELMPKTAFKDVLETVYGKGTSAVSKMSMKNPPEKAEKLFKAVKKIMNETKNP